MAQAKLIYDQGCPVCCYFMNLVKSKIGTDDAQYLPASGVATDFEYVNKLGKRFSGTTAIEQMAKDFPAIKTYMYALPDKYKVLGLKVAYKMGSVARQVYGKVTGRGCNCGKRH